MKALDLATGAAVALAAAQATGYAAGYLSALLCASVALIAAPAIGLAAGLGGRVGSGKRSGRALQAVCALAAASGCLVAIYMWLYSCHWEALSIATRVDDLPYSAMSIGLDLKLQWSLPWIFLRTGGIYLIAWILAGMIAATALTGGPIVLEPKRLVGVACGLALFASLFGWGPISSERQSEYPQDPIRTPEYAWSRLNPDRFIRMFRAGVRSAPPWER